LTDFKARLTAIQCFLMDMDGTIYLGDQLLPGALDWLALLKEHQISYYFLTNNSSRSRIEYAEKLHRLGLEIPEDRIFTSGEATAITLQEKYPQANLYVVGTRPLTETFNRYGFTLNDTDPDVVVLGFDTTLTYEKLRKICDQVVMGKPYIATHPDINCPTANGFKPDIGAMIAFIAASTGRQPDLIIGKPYEPMVNALAQKTGYPVEAHCLIGDRLYTDIALGKWGITTVLVLSGETKAHDLCDSEFEPDFVVSDIAGMAELFKSTLG